MRDPRCGSGALVAVTCLLIVKFAALGLVLEHRLWAALVVAPIVGRSSGPLLFLPGRWFYTPYVQPTGIARDFIEHCPPQARWISYAAIAVGGAMLGAPLQALTVIAICAIMLLLLRRLMQQRLGGSTGDAAGAATEILETTLLLACAVLLPG